MKQGLEGFFEYQNVTGWESGKRGSRAGGGCLTAALSVILSAILTGMLVAISGRKR